jgi:hypothetical protein
MLHRSKTQLLEPLPNRALSTFFCEFTPVWRFSPSTGSERVLDLVLLRRDG